MFGEPDLVHSFEADSFVRRLLRQCWIKGHDRPSLAKHRGPLPHPLQDPNPPLADEDDEKPGNC